MTHTQKDIDRLVQVAQDISTFLRSGTDGVFGGSAMERQLTRSLEPFQPDPEEVLVEMMMRVHQDMIASMNSRMWTFDQLSGSDFEEVKAGMRAALAVVKEHDKRYGIS
jgi:hypothetical protein